MIATCEHEQPDKRRRRLTKIHDAHFLIGNDGLLEVMADPEYSQCGSLAHWAGGHIAGAYMKHAAPYRVNKAGQIGIIAEYMQLGQMPFYKNDSFESTQPISTPPTSP